MQKFTTEMMLSVAVIILTVLAIVVFIVNGSGAAFYGLFVVAVVVMVYTWYRISNAPSFNAEPEAEEEKAPKKTSHARRRRRRR